MRAVEARGRWIWAVSGVVTTAFLVVPGIHLITSGGQNNENAEPQATVTRTVTVPQPVTSLTVQSYGAQVQVTAGPVGRVKITETITYDTQAGDQSAVPQQASASPVSAAPAGAAAPASPAAPAAPAAPANAGGAAPAVALSVSGGHLSLADPECASSDCSVSFAVFTPPGVTATVLTDGGPVTVSGIAGANVDSGGGPVSATAIGGPLTVSTEGGSLGLDGLAGPLRADTDGGPLSARNIAAATVTVSTGNGSASMAFAAAPDSVTVSTDGGPAQLTVPGGPYALAADSNGGPQSVGIATDPAARRSITIITDGGSLGIAPSRS
ncbi:MAG: hypothetical protein ABSB76_20515 [Streptosporangiaceae bacterium]|jgi:hypothetical protein